MPVIKIQDAVNGKFKYQKTTKKPIDTGTLVFLNTLFEHGGSVFRPLFEGTELFFPRGIKVNEHKKWTGLGVHFFNLID